MLLPPDGTDATATDLIRKAGYTRKTAYTGAVTQAQRALSWGDAPYEAASCLRSPPSSFMPLSSPRARQMLIR